MPLVLVLYGIIASMMKNGEVARGLLSVLQWFPSLILGLICIVRITTLIFSEESVSSSSVRGYYLMPKVKVRLPSTLSLKVIFYLSLAIFFAFFIGLLTQLIVNSFFSMYMFILLEYQSWDFLPAIIKLLLNFITSIIAFAYFLQKFSGYYLKNGQKNSSISVITKTQENRSIIDYRLTKISIFSFLVGALPGTFLVIQHQLNLGLYKVLLSLFSLSLFPGLVTLLIWLQYNWKKHSKQNNSVKFVLTGVFISYLPTIVFLFVMHAIYPPPPNMTINTLVSTSIAASIYSIIFYAVSLITNQRLKEHIYFLAIFLGVLAYPLVIPNVMRF